MRHGGWRLLLALGALPAFLTFFIRWWVPESPRWREANAKNPPGWGEVFAGGGSRHAALGALLGAVALLGTWGSVQWIPSWAHQLSHASPGAREAAQIASASGSILGALTAGLFSNFVTRRTAYSLMCLGSLIISFILFRTQDVYGSGFLVWAFLVGAVTASFYGWLPLYLPELFPTRMRAAGQGLAFNAGRVFAAGGTLVSGALLNVFHEDYARMGAWTSLIYLIGLGVIVFAPETKGRPLPE